MQKSHTKVFDQLGFRLRFAEHWARFLHENYKNPESVSVAFNVRFQTAQNWWNGANRPSGDVVAMAFLRHPDTFPEFVKGHQ